MVEAQVAARTSRAAVASSVQRALKQHAGAVTEYTETPEAEEFRLSRGELAETF